MKLATARRLALESQRRGDELTQRVCGSPWWEVLADLTPERACELLTFAVVVHDVDPYPAGTALAFADGSDDPATARFWRFCARMWRP